MVRTVAQNTLAVLGGLIAGMVANMVLIFVSWAIWPPPEGFDMNDAEQLAAFIASLPTGALLLAVVAHNAQAVVGGWLAARLSASWPLVWAVLIGVLTAAGSAVNLAQYGGPVWMWVDVPLNLGLAALVGWLEVQRRARKAA